MKRFLIVLVMLLVCVNAVLAQDETIAPSSDWQFYIANSGEMLIIRDPDSIDPLYSEDGYAFTELDCVGIETEETLVGNLVSCQYQSNDGPVTIQVLGNQASNGRTRYVRIEAPESVTIVTLSGTETIQISTTVVPTTAPTEVAETAEVTPSPQGRQPEYLFENTESDLMIYVSTDPQSEDYYSSFKLFSGLASTGALSQVDLAGRRVSLLRDGGTTVIYTELAILYSPAVIIPDQNPVWLVAETAETIQGWNLTPGSVHIALENESIEVFPLTRLDLNKYSITEQGSEVRDLTSSH